MKKDRYRLIPASRTKLPKNRPEASGKSAPNPRTVYRTPHHLDAARRMVDSIGFKFHEGQRVLGWGVRTALYPDVETILAEGDGCKSLSGLLFYMLVPEHGGCWIGFFDSVGPHS